jgi:hypothetical protein
VGNKKIDREGGLYHKSRRIKSKQIKVQWFWLKSNKSLFFKTQHTYKVEKDK